MSEQVFMFDNADPEMQQAYQAARASFRYFWRELSWERRRIVPGLDLAMVKLPFTDGPRTDGNSEVEHMWIGDVGFDGNSISGKLLNAPNWLTSVIVGDQITVPFSQLTDWMMASNGRAYGGFTVNLMRSRMSPKERGQHDQAWGLEFGDPAAIQIEIAPSHKPKTGLLAGLFNKSSRLKTLPDHFQDHPMCVNMIPKIEAQLQTDPSIASAIAKDGWSLLHHEALAGNLGLVKLLVAFGADPAMQTPGGNNASDLARKIGWSEVAAFLQT